MTGPGDYPLPSDKALAERLQRIDARLDQLEGARSAGFTTLSQGAFVVTDTLGAARVRLGLLSDGTYGLEIVDEAGRTISVNQALFGVVSDFTTTATNLSTVFPGAAVDLSVSVPITLGSTGKAQVIYGTDVALQILSVGSAFVGAAGGAFYAIGELLVDGQPDSAYEQEWSQVRIGTIVGDSTRVFDDPAGMSIAGVNASLATSALIDVGPGAHTLTLRAWSTDLVPGHEYTNRHVVASNPFINVFPL